MDEGLEKSTHSSRIELWQPIVRSPNGKYIAVLSDDSVDRDGEIVGKSALQKIMANDGYTAILLNHKNDVLGQIGEWVNKRIEDIEGHTAFVAEPKFYMSNPNAQIIKGCLDEGAQYGISIGAIPRSSEYVEKAGKKTLMYTDLELLEASFVAIPSNRHGMAMAVAKMFSVEKTEEVAKMADEAPIEKTFTQKELDEVQALHKLAVEGLEKQMSDLVEKHKVELEGVKKELDELKKMSVMKGDSLPVEENAEMQKAIESGMMPIMRRR